MRGKKAKAIAKITEKYEPRVNKHGARRYQLDKNGTVRIASGFTLLYRAFKKAYKGMNKKTVDDFIRRENNG